MISDLNPDLAGPVASIVAVTVPVSPVVTIVPVVAGRVIVLVPAMLAEDNVIVPEVAPFNFIDLPELKDKCSDEVHDEVEETQLIVLSVIHLTMMWF